MILLQTKEIKLIIFQLNFIKDKGEMYGNSDC